MAGWSDEGVSPHSWVCGAFEVEVCVTSMCVPR